MPHANPAKSFDVAVRHLFRHLHDGAALRINPLLKRVSADGFPAPDQFAHEVRRQVLRAAAQCRSEELGRGFDALAERRYAIIAGLCAGERPENTGNELAISLRQYYRDRQAICAKVARHLATEKPISNGITINDPFGLCIRRADALVDHGFSLKAVTLLRDVLRHVQSAEKKVAAYLGETRAHIQYGSLNRALESLQAAKRCLKSIASNEGAFTSLHDECELTAVDVCLASGDQASARVSLSGLLKRRSRQRAKNHVADELTLTVLLEGVSLHVMDGRFSPARNLIRDARALISTIEQPRSDFRGFLAVMEAASCEDGARSVDECIVFYDEALRISLSAGSARNALYALWGLMRCHLQIAEENPAFRCFESGVQIARTMEGTKPILSAAIAGTAMISTRYWRSVWPLLQEVGPFAAPGSLKCAQLRAALGMCLARQGMLTEALECLIAASDVVVSLGNQRAQANVLRERAVVLHSLGRSQEAADMIVAAMELAENGTSVLSLLQTYRAAARILEDRDRPVVGKLAKLADLTQSQRTQSQCRKSVPGLPNGIRSAHEALFPRT
jgi:tetratricopeptide (TPR) repeat protein